VNGTDVSGHVLVMLTHIPGNILKGNWKVRVYVDDKASAAQKDALLNVWTGKLGGPIADLAKLVGEVLSVEQTPITFAVGGAARSRSSAGECFRGAARPPGGRVPFATETLSPWRRAFVLRPACQKIRGDRASRMSGAPAVRVFSPAPS